MPPRTLPIWKPADSYTMTDALDAAELLPGKTQRGRRVAWFGGWPPGYAIGICGKEVVEAVRIDAGQTRPPSSGMLKSRGCDAMTGGWREPLWKEHRIAGTQQLRQV